MSLFLKSVVAILIPIVLFVVAWFYNHGLVDQSVVDRAESVSESIENSSFMVGTSSEAVTSTSSEASPAPSAAQVEFMESVGIDSEAISFTEAEIVCFREVLGSERVDEIIAGAIPGPLEMYKAKECLLE